MKVILRSNVVQLGKAGDVKEVSPGFGRNYLIPKGLAMLATPARVKEWEKGREKRAKLDEKNLKEVQQLAEKLAGVSLSFARQAGPEEKLFGSVGKADILKSLKSCGHTVEKDAVVLDNAIKKTGEYEIELRLRPEVSAKIKISVVARQ